MMKAIALIEEVIKEIIDLKVSAETGMRGIIHTRIEVMHTGVFSVIIRRII